ncbi:helix-turn-helix transcriptional regulator [Pantoea agglomerans]|nr:AlpA family phage regulatory protein [Pantoea agglomerans]
MTSRTIKKSEVLHRCGFSNATLYRLIAKGWFPSPRLLSRGAGCGLAGI